MPACTNVGVMSPLAFAEIRCEYGERRRDDKVVMAASGLQTELASRSRLEGELSEFPAQEIAAGRLLGNSKGAAPHGGAEPLDQPRLASDQPVPCAEPASGRSPPIRQTPTCGGVFGSSSAAASPRPL